jgi:hypothetical protein
MSDHIEEDDEASQRSEVDAVDPEEEEEDQQPRPPPRRRVLSRSAQGESSRSAAAAASAARNSPELEGDDDAQDATTHVFDETALGNRPLGRHDGQKLQGMASDWNTIETNLKESAFSLLTEVSAAVAEYGDDKTATKVIGPSPSLRSRMLTLSLFAHAGTREAGCSHERYHRH